jgi:hypothetical protein
MAAPAWGQGSDDRDVERHPMLEDWGAGPQSPPSILTAR